MIYREILSNSGNQQTSMKHLSHFTLYSTLSRGAGIGGLGITVEGPSESKINCRDNKDGSCSAEYIPFAPGDYDVNITYGGAHIPGKQSRRNVSRA